MAEPQQELADSIRRALRREVHLYLAEVVTPSFIRRALAQALGGDESRVALTDKAKLALLREWAEEESKLEVPEHLRRVDQDRRYLDDVAMRKANARLVLEILDGRIPSVFKGRFNV